MSEVRFASTALYFGSIHAMRIIGSINDIAFSNGVVEAGPAAAALEFGIAFKERIATGCAEIGADLFAVFEGTGPGALGSFHPCDVKHVGWKHFFPFVFSEIDFGGVGMGVDGGFLIHVLGFGGGRLHLGLALDGQKTHQGEGGEQGLVFHRVKILDFGLKRPTYTC